MTRLAIDWDGDGAFAVINRGAQPAKVIRTRDCVHAATKGREA